MEKLLNHLFNFAFWRNLIKELSHFPGFQIPFACAELAVRTQLHSSSDALFSFVFRRISFFFLQILCPLSSKLHFPFISPSNARLAARIAADRRQNGAVQLSGSAHGGAAARYPHPIRRCTISSGYSHQHFDGYRKSHFSSLLRSLAGLALRQGGKLFDLQNLQTFSTSPVFFSFRLKYSSFELIRQN